MEIALAGCQLENLKNLRETIDPTEISNLEAEAESLNQRIKSLNGRQLGQKDRKTLENISRLASQSQDRSLLLAQKNKDCF